jgi:hypothetical protein
MIDAQPGVAGKGIPEIFPEGVDPLARMQRPQRIGPPVLDKAAISIAHLRPEQGVIDPALWRINVNVNGINGRRANLLGWLEEAAPDSSVGMTLKSPARIAGAPLSNRLWA